MLSRVTFRHRSAAEMLLAKLWSDQSGIPNVATPQVLLTDACLRICHRKLAADLETGRNPTEARVYHVLLEAAQARSPGKPLWAGYAEATRHLVERTLGMRVQGDGSVGIADADRARSQICGTYSTPDFIADTMVREVIRELPRFLGQKLTILDLSLEAGQFPLAFIHSCSSREAHFYGIDRDPVTIEIAKRLFQYSKRASASRWVRLSLANQDSLLEDIPRAWPREFSVIIGNPPWKGRHPKYTETVRERFRPILSGNFDIYLAFFLRAHELVQTGGLVCFTVPSTFLFNQTATTIRHMLLHNYDILSLRLYPQRSFIEVPCLIPISILARRRTSDRHRPATLISYHPVLLGGSRRPRSEVRVHVTGIWECSPGAVLHPLIRKELAFLYSELSPQALKDFGNLACGARLSKRTGLKPERAFVGLHARHIRAFHACACTAPWYRPEDPRFSRSPSYRTIDSYKVVFQDLRYMTHSVRLVAAVACPGTTAVSTASTFLPYNAVLVHFYEALLNSCFANAWYKARDVSRSIKLAVLSELPVVFDSCASVRIEALARECSRIRIMIHEAVRYGPTAEDRLLTSAHPLASLWKDTKHQIDEEIFDLYGSTTAERAAARRFVDARVF